MFSVRFSHFQLSFRSFVEKDKAANEFSLFSVFGCIKAACRLESNDEREGSGAGQAQADEWGCAQEDRLTLGNSLHVSSSVQFRRILLLLLLPPFFLNSSLSDCSAIPTFSSLCYR